MISSPASRMTLFRNILLRACALVLLGAVAAPLPAQDLITTVAGTDRLLPIGRLNALGIPIVPLGAPAVDSSGNFYFVDNAGSQILEVTPGGILQVIAGNGLRGFSGDSGPAIKASLRFPSAVAVDVNANVFIADQDNHRIRRVDAQSHLITTIAGSGFAGYSGDGGPAITASFGVILGLAIDQVTGDIYLADGTYHVIRRIDGSTGIISTFVGRSTGLFQPHGLAVDSGGALYIADRRNNRVLRATTAGITRVAGTGEAGYNGDGIPAPSAMLFEPTALAFDPQGNLIIADFGNQRIRRVTGSIINTIAGTGAQGFAGDGGPATRAVLNYPQGVAADKSGNIFVLDILNARIRKIAQGTINTVAGTSERVLTGENIPATFAYLNTPEGVAVDSSGNMYIADFSTHRIRRVTPGGVISTFAGTGDAGYSGDGGPATAARLNGPTDVTADGNGNVYIADYVNHVVRRVNPNGIIQTIAGTGVPRYDGDGTATTHSLSFPESVAVNREGIVVVADSGNNLVREITPDGRLLTIAGRPLLPGYTGDGGPAADADLYYPRGVAFDGSGNLLIADSYNSAIRRIDATTGIITTVAGTGRPGVPSDGAIATSAPLNFPERVTADRFDNVYIADSGNAAIRRVGTNGIIGTAAGTGIDGYSGDGGPANRARISFTAGGLVVDNSGNLLIADTGNQRIRSVLATAPGASASPTSLSFTTKSGAAPTPSQTVRLTSLSGLGYTAQGSASWIRVTPATGLMPAVLQVSVDPQNLAPGNYHGTVNIAAVGAAQASLVVSVSATILPNDPAMLSVDTRGVRFAVTTNSDPAQQQLLIRNTGGGSLAYQAAPETAGDLGWLSLEVQRGTATAANPGEIAVNVSPEGLLPGTYTGTIRLHWNAGDLDVPVIMAVSQARPRILLTQTGMTFTAVAQGADVPPQNFGILNAGTGTMPWTASVSPLSGGNWISLDSTQGVVSTPFVDVATVGVSINPAGLSPGDYYGAIQVSSAGAPNSPQSITVILNVLPAGSDPGPVVSPTSLIFTGEAGVSPGSQDLLVSNPALTSTSFTSARTTDPGSPDWFATLPTDATVPANTPQRIVVQPNFEQLEAGRTYPGILTLRFEDGTTRTVNMLSVVAPAGAGTGASKIRNASGCGSALQAIATTFGDPSATASLGQPATLEVRVIDGCGDAVTQDNGGSVAAGFDNGDAQVDFVHISDGNWRGTWTPLNQANRVAVSIEAFQVAADRSFKAGKTTLNVGLKSGAATPVAAAAVNAASFEEAFISPGGLITIFGDQLTNGVGETSSATLPTEINGTRVLLAGHPLPLRFVNSSQVNAQVPFELDANTLQQLVVERGVARSVPQNVTVAEAQPAVYTQDVSGSGPGVIVNASQGNTVVTADHPASVGDTLVIYCNGLGAVDPAVSSGTPAPLAGPLSWTVNEVTVTIDGVTVPSIFAGLTPGYADLYQVNVTIPAGVASGDDVPVVLNVAGQASPPVTIAVQ